MRCTVLLVGLLCIVLSAALTPEEEEAERLALLRRQREARERTARFEQDMASTTDLADHARYVSRFREDMRGWAENVRPSNARDLYQFHYKNLASNTPAVIEAQRRAQLRRAQEACNTGRSLQQYGGEGAACDLLQIRRLQSQLSSPRRQAGGRGAQRQQRGPTRISFYGDGQQRQRLGRPAGGNQFSTRGTRRWGFPRF